MKLRIIFCVLLMMVVGVVSSCVAQEAIFANGRSYAAAVDTSDTVVVSTGDCVLAFLANDSCNVAIAVDYTISGSSVWATYNAVADSTNSVVGAGMYQGYVLRRGSTNNIPGATRARVRVIKRTTKNGVTSATYSAWLTRN